MLNAMNLQTGHLLLLIKKKIRRLYSHPIFSWIHQCL